MISIIMYVYYEFWWADQARKIGMKDETLQV